MPRVIHADQRFVQRISHRIRVRDPTSSDPDQSGTVRHCDSVELLSRHVRSADNASSTIGTIFVEVSAGSQLSARLRRNSRGF